VFIRIDDGILEQVQVKPAPIERDAEGELREGALQKLMEASEREEGPWYAVHHGYEVQICDDADENHRTGAIYSLAKAAAVTNGAAGEWRTMVITLKGPLVSVAINGQQVTTFDPSSADIRSDRNWYEPKREPPRPETGYVGLQNHDPGDVVYFREVSVRPLP
jgi:hypothetical protein